MHTNRGIADYRAEGELWALTTAALVVIGLPLALAPIFLGATLPFLGMLLVMTALTALGSAVFGMRLRLRSMPLPERGDDYAALRRARDRASKAVGLDPGDVCVCVYRDEQRANAFTLGLRRPWPVFLSTSLLTALGADDDALAAVLAHEFSHIRFGHTVLALVLRAPAGAAPWRWLALAARVVLSGASRLQELTADRGACLCAGPEALLRALLAARGLSASREELPALLADWRAAERRLGARLWLLIAGTHPPIAQRMQALASFVRTERYAALVGDERAEKDRAYVRDLEPDGTRP